MQSIRELLLAGILLSLLGVHQSLAGVGCDPLVGVELGRLVELQEDSFGYSVDLDESFIVVGAPEDDEFGLNSGAVYVYVFDGVGWVEQVKLSGGDTTAGDFFGISVSISEGKIVVGASGDDDFGSRSGSAYMFEFDGVDWVQVAKLNASDAGSTDTYGRSVSISGDWVLVGADRDDENGDNAGAAYVYGFDGALWVENAKLMASDGVEYGEFGVSVSISGDCAVVGATGDPVNGVASGSTYVFRHDGSDWLEESKLVPDDGNAADFFGEVVSINGDRAIVGARWDDDNGSNSGSAYVFEFADEDWVQHGKLIASDGAALDVFGFSAAIWGDYAIVSALQNDNGDPNTLKAYLFEHNGSDWIEVSAIVGIGGGAEGNTSNTVAIQGDTALIGSINTGVVDGSAFVYDLGCYLQCQADLTGEGTLDFFDISAFLSAFEGSDPVADFTGDGSFDFFDISAFLSAYAEGCP